MGVNKQKLEDYEGFVDKFKPKLTTDDCYTPAPVYDVIKNYVSEKYGIKESQIVRPFYPGGDYENFEYEDGCCVVDNPPFSILAKIVDFYLSHTIPFFLFAPYLTCGWYFNRENVTIVVTPAEIVYDNGARVMTSFITNLEPDMRLRVDPDLYSQIKEAVEIYTPAKANLPKYQYPENVITIHKVGQLAKRGLSFDVPAAESICCRALDAQRLIKKEIYGGGLLVSDRLVKEKEAKEKEYIWTLSEREREIIEGLNKQSGS